MAFGNKYSKNKKTKSTVQRNTKKINHLLRTYKPERKFSMSNELASPVGWGGKEYHLSVTTQGDRNDQRNGLSANLQTLYIRGTVFRQSVNATVRIIYFIDTENQRGVAPVATEILGDNPQYVNTSNAPNSFLSRNNLGRFKILKSRMLTVDADRPNKYFKEFIRIPSKYSKATWAINTNFNKNQVWMLVISNIDTAGTPPTIDFASRVSYFDN